jgi:hypothetical protein
MIVVRYSWSLHNVELLFLFLLSGMQYSGWATLYKEINGHADINNDQGYSPLGTRPRKRDQQFGQAGRLQ